MVAILIMLAAVALFAGQDPDVYFYGESLERVSEREYTLINGAFTTCVQPTPRWDVVSGHATIKVDRSVSMTGKIGRAHV